MEIKDMSETKCENCNGKGYFVINKKVGNKEYPDVIEYCSVCNGKGFVEKESHNE